MASYTVTAFHGRGNPFGEDKEWGPLIPRRMELEGVEGVVAWNRKPADADPKVGETLEGELEQTQYGFKFKKSRQGGGFGGGKSPEQQKSIVRQHSQEMALRYMAIQVARGVVPEGFDYSNLTPIIDWFVKDAGS